MAIHRVKLSDKGPENRIEKILPWTSKVFKDSLEEIAIVQRIRDAETLQRLSDEKDRADQKCREFKEALVTALQAIRRLEQEEEEQSKPVLNEEEKIDFFPKWKPQQGIIGETKEEEREEEEMPILDERDVETDGLIREYQRNAKPT